MVYISSHSRGKGAPDEEKGTEMSAMTETVEINKLAEELASPEDSGVQRFEDTYGYSFDNAADMAKCVTDCIRHGVAIITIGGTDVCTATVEY